MSGIIAVYGLVVSVLIAGNRTCLPRSPSHLSVTRFRFRSRTVSPRVDYPLFAGFVHLGAGLACGFTGLAAGYAIGFVGDSVRL
jgi:V-type H+-transporting ATPase proteolipid subunit